LLLHDHVRGEGEHQSGVSVVVVRGVPDETERNVNVELSVQHGFDHAELDFGDSILRAGVRRVRGGNLGFRNIRRRAEPPARFRGVVREQRVPVRVFWVLVAVHVRAGAHRGAGRAQAETSDRELVQVST